MAKFVCTFLLMLPMAFVIQNARVEGYITPGDCASTCDKRCSAAAYKTECLNYCNTCCQKCLCPFNEQIFSYKTSGEDLLTPGECASTCEKRCGPVAYKQNCLSYCNMCCGKCLCPFSNEPLNTREDMSMLP
uniref:Uncharacterized protein LOC105852209 isoform X2 n=1 Tax=Cicer arietinum TaxID=3827 RepID=A0A3Q7YF84_CICAR|nr:uncharacterized protein LOC105852209 isoform X2 [Cicer arietinum]